MKEDIKVPVLPESVQNAKIATWHKKTGDFVLQHEKLVDIETDKVILEVVATNAGKLAQILKTAGAKVIAQEVIGSIEENSSDNKVISNIKQESYSAQVAIAKYPSVIPASSESNISPSARRNMKEHKRSNNPVESTTTTATDQHNNKNQNRLDKDPHPYLSRSAGE